MGVMKNAKLLQVARFALLAACLMSPMAQATEPVTSGERGTQTGAAAAIGANDGNGAGQRAAAKRNQGLPPFHGQRPLPGSHVPGPRPPVIATARSYLLRKPQPAQLVRRALPAVPGPRAMSAATLSPNASRPASGIYGTSSRSSPSLKPSGGNGVVGGPHVAGGGMIGGAGNSRRVIKGGIDGAAFHHRS
jgi:hypothetical protein